MKLALVCGDGLPVSGLLTVFRNVLDLLPEPNLLDLPVPADLGYSWRPDKPAFFPSGSDAVGYPDWLSVTRGIPVADPGLAEELVGIRREVARAELLDPAERSRLNERIEALTQPYEQYFTRWLDEHDVDWVCAINMTLSDAVPVTLALHRAVDRRWGSGRPGGILFWDHDLFGSYAVHDGGERIYPAAPNEFTPLPGAHPAHRWAVVTDGLAKETAGYATSIVPVAVPNVLPAVPTGELEERHHEFIARHGIDPVRPVILVPARVFRVKGVEISVALLAAVRKACLRRGAPVPYLLVFGDLGEDPEYSREVLAAVEEFAVHDDIRFLGGVPLGTHRDRTGHWRLDEVDLLRIADRTDGGVFFTPNRSDVESVGLGPALAAVAGLPCAVTGFDVFDEVYGKDFHHVHVQWDAELDAAGEQFTDWLVGRRAGAEWVREAMEFNHGRVVDRFPTWPWRALLGELVAALAHDHTSREETA
jgi:glycosyltransferase involved in cell wall biosynthesis